MPIEIIRKKKTVPTHVIQHKELVPLCVAEIKPERISNDARREGMHKYVQLTDIIVLLPDTWAAGYIVFNCTRNICVPSWCCEAFTVVRAYDVQQVILTNDSEPAPI